MSEAANILAKTDETQSQISLYQREQTGPRHPSSAYLYGTSYVQVLGHYSLSHH